MDKKIVLKKQTIALFILNIIILLLSIMFKNIYEKLGYYELIINIFFFINMLFLIMGIAVNILMFLKQNSFDYKRTIKILILYFIFYLILNTFIIILINKPIKSSFDKVTNKLVNYCDKYNCDTFNTKTNEQTYEFVLEKKYLDYNGNTNYITIKNYYNNKEIIKIVAEVTSQKELFSEYLIKEEVKEWFSYFDFEVNDELIKEAFNNRFNNVKTKDNNSFYEVNEIYENKVLTGLKTTITLNVK